MRIILLSVTVLISSLILFSCKKNNPIPPEEQPEVSLALEDVSCTEAWIKLSVNNISLPADVDLYKDSSLTETINLATADTVLYVDVLLPYKSYSFHSVIQSINQSSNSLNVTTMDTTSQDFTWQTWTFGGQAGSCTLYDCDIITADDIWCVGEIYLLDSTGVPDPNAYNAVHWDGSQWELKRIKTNACGGVDYPPIKTVFAFSSNDILFAHIDGSISHYNGIEFTNDCSLITQLNGSANKIWGMSRNDFYVVSGNGFIAHYQNGQWSRIESGTDLNINDIWGDYNENSSEWEILAVGGNILHGSESERVILKINNNQVEMLNAEGASWPLSSIWFKPDRKYYIVGSGGKFRKNNLSEEIWKPLNILSNYHLYRIRGSKLNEIVAAGAFGELLYFNGFRWGSYLDEAGLNYGIFFSVVIKNNIIAAVGFDYQNAAITIGKRSN